MKRKNLYTGEWKKTEETKDYTKWQLNPYFSDTYIIVSKLWGQENSFYSELREDGIQAKIYSSLPTFESAFEHIQNYVAEYGITLNHEVSQKTLKMYIVRDNSPDGVKNYRDTNPNNQLSVRVLEVYKKGDTYKAIDPKSVEAHTAKLEEEVLSEFVYGNLYIWTTNPERIDLMKKSLVSYKIKTRQEDIAKLQAEIEAIKKQWSKISSDIIREI